MRLQSWFLFSLSVGCAFLTAACADNARRGGGDANDLGFIYPDTANADVAEPDAKDPVDTVEAPDVPELLDVGPGEPELPDPEDVPVILPDLTEPADVAAEVLAGPDVIVSTTTCSSPGGALNIFDLQNPECPDHVTPEPLSSADAVPVFLEDVVVTAVFSDTVFVQEKIGGPYSGIGIFTHGIPTTELSPGTLVDVKGTWSEYYDNSQIYLESFTITGSSALEPQPWIIDHPSQIATESPYAEYFEGVLVRVENVKTINTKPDCPEDYAEFAVTGGLRIDDMGVDWDARLGDEFESITGPLHYAFGNFKIEPRNDFDLELTSAGGTTAITKCIANECQVLASNPGTKTVIVNEIMADPLGDDVGREWIELRNPGNTAVDVTGWELRDCGAQAWSIAGSDAVIKPGGFLVLGQNTNTGANGGAPVSAAYGTDFYLPNTIGSVLLFDGAGPTAKLVDQTRYSRFDPWTIFKVGKSLERVSATSDGTLPAGWKTATDEYGDDGNFGSPGKSN